MTMNNRAFFELRRGNLDPALRDVDEALVRNPDEGIAHATKAEILAQLGRIDASYARLARAIELSEERINTAIESEFLEPLRRDARWPCWLDKQRRRPR
jgi:tetratricopeptide (TPR) repeat protein